MSAPPPAQDAAKAEEPKLSPAEQKKRAKAEKQARRAAQKEQQPPSSTSGEASSVNGVNGAQRAQQQDGGPSQQAKAKADKQQKTQQQQKQAQESQGQHTRTGSQSQAMPFRRRPSQSGPPDSGTPHTGPVRGAPASAQSASVPKTAEKRDTKQVQLFSHLYEKPRRHAIEGISKDVHPAVLALGFQISSYEICGSSARCVAMLLAFKEAIQAYTTPAGTSLARHLTSHYLSPQIDFLKSCRPISESMGNAIRWLKKLIVAIDPSMPEQEAKNDLCERIDTFIHERITVTDQAIADSASRQIKHRSVVLTFGKSSIVEKTILEAHANGTKFRVIVIDSRPLFEGKNLATSLMNAELEVDYLPYSAISHAVKQATLVLLGAHSMLSNGHLQSRAGTAAVAMQAAKADIPVVVCCESVKFSGKFALDSIALNEVAPSEELLLPQPAKIKPAEAGDEEEVQSKTKTLNDWRDISNLQILNLMYDVTPAEYIRIIICEYGSIPPSSVPVVHRLANDQEGM